jgi:hypothetical protein
MEMEELRRSRAEATSCGLYVEADLEEVEVIQAAALGFAEGGVKAKDCVAVSVVGRAAKALKTPQGTAFLCGFFWVHACRFIYLTFDIGGLYDHDVW